MKEPAPARKSSSREYFEKLNSPAQQADRMIRKLQRLGYTVELKRPAA